MAKRADPEIVEVMHEENRHEIGKLKDAIAELSTSLAVNTEVTEGLKEAMEREFVRHVDERKSIGSRVMVVRKPSDRKM
jgi:hypothetical protein